LTRQMTISDITGENDERALLLAARAGDERALGVLLDRHRSGLELYCFLMLGDRESARAALAQTTSAARDACGVEAPETSARVWLYRLAIGACSEADPRCAVSFGVEDRLTGEQR
jgi:DNA-directed RNA polymerase specialized sigma24 family protein